MNKSTLVIALLTCANAPVTGQSDGSATVKATPEQARSFAIDMIEQYSVISCRDVDYDTDIKSLSKISGNRVTIQTMTTSYGRRSHLTDEETTTVSFIIGDVQFQIQSRASGSCPQVGSYIVVKCKTGSSCVKQLVNAKRNDPDASDYSRQTSEISAVISMNDAEMAKRVASALTFYQQHAPAAAASPF